MAEDGHEDKPDGQSAAARKASNTRSGFLGDAVEHIEPPFASEDGVFTCGEIIGARAVQGGSAQAKKHLEFNLRHVDESGMPPEEFIDQPGVVGRKGDRMSGVENPIGQAQVILVQFRASARIGNLCGLQERPLYQPDGAGPVQ